MKDKTKRSFIITAILFLLFIIFTVIVSCVDVQSIGPQGSEVGLATLNKAVFELLGANTTWYDITEMIGIFALAVAFGFALLGGAQLIKRKSIAKVDRQILILGVFYAAVVAMYILFEVVVINYRPIILETDLEASYPSSHTMMVICIMATAMMQFDRLFRKKKALHVVLNVISAVIIAVMVAGRLLSGVHWFTDIIAGALLASALVMLYHSAVSLSDERSKNDPSK